LGLDASQTLFLAYAQARCGVVDADAGTALDARAARDRARKRVNDVLGGSGAFAEAFRCSPADAMFAARKPCDPSSSAHRRERESRSGST
jgi:hypothetical protein